MTLSIFLVMHSCEISEYDLELLEKFTNSLSKNLTFKRYDFFFCETLLVVINYGQVEFHVNIYPCIPCEGGWVINAD